jgi:hypothetical protein
LSFSKRYSELKTAFLFCPPPKKNRYQEDLITVGGENLFGLLRHYQVTAFDRPDQKEKEQQGYNDPCCADNGDDIVGC